MKKCVNCGYENADSARFCENCGTTDFVSKKKCPQCNSAVKPEAKFCFECGYNFLTGNAPAASGTPDNISIGDKNVFAGDVVGKQENMKFFGNATIVKNEDETKKTVQCHVCGHNISILQSVNCPVCRKMTCENCFDESLKSCKCCIDQKNTHNEKVYVNAFCKAFEDEIITLEERQQLNYLQKQLGISAARAFELEKQTKENCLISKNSSSLSSFVQISLEKALDLLYDAGDAQKAYESLLPIYQRYPENEEVLTSFIAAAIQINPQEALNIIQHNQADVVNLHLVCIDYDLMNGDLDSAEKRLNTATNLWPGNLLVKCRKIMCFMAMYEKLHADTFLKMADNCLANFPQPQNKLEASWACRVQYVVRSAMGHDIPEITRAYCNEHNLYFAIANGNSQADEKMFQSTQDLQESTPMEHLETVIKLAENGHADAQYELAECYSFGEGVDEDDEEAFKWYRKAAEQGHANAQYELADCYYLGNGVDEDDEEAFKWYRKAAEQGHANAQYWVAKCYYDGIGIEEDCQEAVKWYGKAAQQGYADAQYELAECYSLGEGVNEDNKEAFKWYRKAAEQGHANAQYELADCYYLGNGVNEDDKEASNWYRKAAEQGHAAAQYWLARCYYYGIGIETDFTEAGKWYQMAADQGHEDAKIALKELLETVKNLRK